MMVAPPARAVSYTHLMELTITNGRGYVGAEKNKNEDTPIGVLAVDSIYTPVERVKDVYKRQQDR